MAHAGAHDVLSLRDTIVPLVDLVGRLGLAGDPIDARAGGATALIVTAGGGALVGLLVQQVERQLDVILSPLHGVLSTAPCLLGTAMMGDGDVLLVLDTEEVVRDGAGVG